VDKVFSYAWYMGMSWLVYCKEHRASLEQSGVSIAKLVENENYIVPH